MPKRVQSPSSINTYNQCARKYFYQYIVKLPTKQSIHTLRGGLVHSILEKFYELEPTHFSKNTYREDLSLYLKNLFNAYWAKNKKSMQTVDLGGKSIEFYYEETAMMLANWLTQFFKKLEPILEVKTFSESFGQLKPIEMEEEYKCEDLSVRGFIDYIENVDGKIRVMDYKTSKKFDISPEYKLQLGIYAVLYNVKNGEPPHEVGIWFLKDKEVVIPVTQELLDYAKSEINKIHLMTESEHINDYPRSLSPLCKWNGGRCDFYDVCKPHNPQDRD